MTGLLLDLRAGWRGARRAPGFTALGAAVLAAGIAAATAAFSLVDAAVLRGLPFPDSDRLVMLSERPPDGGRNRVAPLNFADWSEQNGTFAGMAAVSGAGGTITLGTLPERISGQSVSRQFFDVLRVPPMAGRTFDDTDVTSRAPVVVLSERFWRTRLGADPRAVGRPLRIDGRDLTVIGVVPASFEILYPAEFWTLFVPNRAPQYRQMHFLQVIGRLAPGVSLAEAAADMGAIGSRIAVIAPQTNRGWGVNVEPLRDAIVSGSLRTTSWALAGMAVCLLLLACANVGNLVLVRALARRREVAVRAVLGASRTRIAWQLLSEQAVLTTIGGGAGGAAAWLLIRAAPALLPASFLPTGVAPVFDARVAVCVAMMTAAAALLCALAPIRHAGRVPPIETLASHTRSVAGGAQRFRSALVVVQLGTAVLLVTCAGLLLRTLAALDAVDPGYHADRVLTMAISLPQANYPTPEQAGTFYERAAHEVEALPGVRSASFGGSLPLSGWDIGQGFTIVGDPPPDPSSTPGAHYQIVGARYFETLGIPLLKGRVFTPDDRGDAVPVCIINEELARRYFAGRDPIGARISVDAMRPQGPVPDVREVVGVIGQVKVEGPGERENALEIYVPISQNPWFWASLAVRTASSPEAAIPAVKQALARVDPGVAPTRVLTMDEIAAAATAQPRFRLRVVGVIAATAWLLAAIGVFGVLALSVDQRRRELGLRFALGAQRADVMRLVLGRAVRLGAAGVAIGLAAAAATTRGFGALLFGVAPLDPLVFAAAALLVATTTLAACALPAWRAATVDPATSLRAE